MFSCAALKRWLGKMTRSDLIVTTTLAIITAVLALGFFVNVANTEAFGKTPSPSDVAPECSVYGMQTRDAHDQAIEAAKQVINRLGGLNEWSKYPASSVVVKAGEYSKLYVKHFQYTDANRRLLNCLLGIIHQRRGMLL